jgi:hypothetical protein
VLGFEEVASELQNIEEDGLSRVASLVRQQLALESRISDLEDELKRTQKQLSDVAENKLPEALAEHGLKHLSMEDGSEINVQNYYSASIKEDRKGEAFDWLRDNGYEDLIKNQVSISLGRKEDEIASNLVVTLREQGFEPLQKTWVEPMTLKAFVKEQVEKGAPIPSETFGIYIGKKAKITRRK